MVGVLMDFQEEVNIFIINKTNFAKQWCNYQYIFRNIIYKNWSKHWGLILLQLKKLLIDFKFILL